MDPPLAISGISGEEVRIVFPRLFSAFALAFRQRPYSFFRFWRTPHRFFSVVLPRQAVWPRGPSRAFFSFPSVDGCGPFTCYFFCPFFFLELWTSARRWVRMPVSRVNSAFFCPVPGLTDFRSMLDSPSPPWLARPTVLSLERLFLFCLGLPMDS